MRSSTSNLKAERVGGAFAFIPPRAPSACSDRVAISIRYWKKSTASYTTILSEGIPFSTFAGKSYTNLDVTGYLPTRLEKKMGMY